MELRSRRSPDAHSSAIQHDGLQVCILRGGVAQYLTRPTLNAGAVHACDAPLLEIQVVDPRIADAQLVDPRHPEEDPHEDSLPHTRLNIGSRAQDLARVVRSPAQADQAGVRPAAELLPVIDSRIGIVVRPPALRTIGSHWARVARG